VTFTCVERNMTSACCIVLRYCKTLMLIITVISVPEMCIVTATVFDCAIFMDTSRCTEANRKFPDWISVTTSGVLLLQIWMIPFKVIHFGVLNRSQRLSHCWKRLWNPVL